MIKHSLSDLQALPLVMISMSRWDGDFSSAAWSLAKTFAKDQVVIYVDYPYTLLDYVRERKDPRVQRRKPALLGGKNAITHLKQYQPKLYALTPPLMLPINWLPKGALHKFFAAWNDGILARSIQKALKQLGFSEFIFFNSFNPLYLSSLPRDFNPALFAYQSRDNIRALGPFLEKHGAKQEIEAIQHADLSFATSWQLQQDLQALSGQEVAHLPNAADFDLFKKAYEEELPEPEELKGLKRPILGYTGNICHRVDYDILAEVCRVHEDKSVVLVGPRNHWGHTEIDLDTIPNLHFVGPKRIEELPSYLAHFDVLMLPFVRNEITRSIYPLKINEYLASGKPVVATPFSEDIKSFSDYLRLESEAQDFAQAMEEELQSNNPQKAQERYQVASTNTWQGRVSQFWQLVADLLP